MNKLKGKATYKQLLLLEKFGIEVPSNLTKQEASDMISDEIDYRTASRNSGGHCEDPNYDEWDELSYTYYSDIDMFLMS